jgi:hypothetical protein
MVGAPRPSTPAPHGSWMGTGGGHYRRYRQHPQRGYHRRLQLRWWPLPDLPLAPPGGPPSTSLTSMVGATGSTASSPQGGCHRRLQLRWWSLPDLPPAPPKGAANDVFNFGSGRCRTCRQHPTEGPPSTSPTFGPPAPAPSGGPSSTSLSVDGGCSRTSSSGTSRGPAVDCRVKCSR